MIKKKSDARKISGILSHIGWEYYTHGQHDSAIVYFHKSLTTFSGDTARTASSLHCIGSSYSSKGYPDSSLTYYKKALPLFVLLKDTAQVINVESNLSYLYKNLGLYDKSLESAFTALSRLEKQPPGRALASCYNTIGSVYSKIADFQNALLYFRRALEVRKQIGYDKGVAQSYNNIGEMYIIMKQYDSALLNLQKSLTIKKDLNDRPATAVTLNFIGEAFLAQHNYQKAEPYFRESRDIKRETGERLEELIALNNLGRLKLAQRDYRVAEKYINDASTLAAQTGALDELRKNLELKVVLFKAIGRYGDALAACEKLVIVKDSLLNEDRARSLLSMQTQYETEKKEQAIKTLEQDKVIQRAEIDAKQIWIRSLAIIVVLILIIGGISFQGYRQSEKGKRRVETLLKELHHRVKNNLQILSSVLGLQSQYITDHGTMKVIKSSESRVNTMALIHKKLYIDGANHSIQMGEYINDLVEYLVHTYGFTDSSLILKLDCQDVYLDVDKAIPLGLIVNEIVSNALKYAFIDHNHPQLAVSLFIQQDRLLKLIVMDNGPGISDVSVYQQSESFGLKMVNTLAKELKAKTSVSSHNGTSFILDMPAI